MSSRDLAVLDEHLASNGADLREKILQLEELMFQSEHKIEFKTEHYFAKGLYAREIFIPKGALLTGKIHKTEHLNIVSLGKIRVWTEEGMKTVEAPYTMVSFPGTKRIGYALEDTVWTTIHGTSETDLEKLEAELIAPSFNDLQLSDEQIMQLEEVCRG